MNKYSKILSSLSRNGKRKILVAGLLAVGALVVGGVIAPAVTVAAGAVFAYGSSFGSELAPLGAALVLLALYSMNSKKTPSSNSSSTPAAPSPAAPQQKAQPAPSAPTPSPTTAFGTAAQKVDFLELMLRPPRPIDPVESPKPAVPGKSGPQNPSV